MKTPERFNFLGTLINATNLGETSAILQHYDFSKRGYVSFPDSSVIALAQNNTKLQNILNHSILTLPDGKPSEIYARVKGFRNVSTVSGYWLCKELFATELTHFFLGGTPEKLTKIVAAVRKEFPQAKIDGWASPAFHEVSFFEQGNLLTKELEHINFLQPDLIWVGVGSPKQDFLMASHAPLLKHGIMLGVGGVFDYLSGDVRKSPEWIKKLGLRWLWRLAKEPNRLGTKYLTTIQIFTRIFLKKIFSANRRSAA